MKTFFITALVGSALAAPAFAQSQGDGNSTRTHASPYAPGSAARYGDDSARYRMYANPPAESSYRSSTGYVAPNFGGSTGTSPSFGGPKSKPFGQ